MPLMGIFFKPHFFISELGVMAAVYSLLCVPRARVTLNVTLMAQHLLHVE